MTVFERILSEDINSSDSVSHQYSGEDYAELERLCLDQMLDCMVDEYGDSIFSDLYDFCNDENVLSEVDFYPPEDRRYLRSGICDVDSTNNFSQFASHYFEMCESENWDY